MSVEELPVPVEEAALFNTADVVVFVLFVLGLTVFFLYNKYEESKTVTIKPISLSQLKPGLELSGLDIVKRMNDSGRKMVVFYGSQTGTAEEFSTRLCKEARYYGLAAMSADPIEYDIESMKGLKEVEGCVAVFLMSTYGEGEPTDNAIQLHDFLKDEDNELEGMNYAVFGLGNSTYEYYNKMGKDTDSLLEKRGAVRVSKLGLGDDDGNIEEDYLQWREVFWGDMGARFGVVKSENNLNIRNYKLVEHASLPLSKVYTGEMGLVKAYDNQRPPYDAKNPYLGSLTVNYGLCNGDSERVVFHCEVDLSKAKIKYEPGDHVAIYPQNNGVLVQKLGTRLLVHLDTVISLDCIDEFSSKKNPFPCPTTYRTALTHYVDITAPPRTNLIKELAQYAKDEDEKAFLLKLASSEGKSQYKEWVVDDQRDISQILEDCPSLQPPIDHLLELLSRLQARYYSIASSPKLHARSVHVCAALVRYTTRAGRATDGVCTTWLHDLRPSETEQYSVPVFVRRNQGFRLPRKPTVPIIMVGPGTGIAPFRGFIQHRAAIMREGRECGENVLFFGCRYEEQDYLYREELRGYEEEGVITLHTAFSRDTDDKVYVQHRMEEQSLKIWELLEKGAHFYICGDAKRMARDVQKQLLRIIQECGSMEELEAATYLSSLENSFRYQKDVWS